MGVFTVKKMLFILNPFAGKAQIKTHLLDIIDIFTKSGYEVCVHPTQNSEDAYNTTKSKASKFNTLVVSGGDGTLNSCVKGLMSIPQNKRPALGYIPAGTANDFASSRNIPKNMKKAARVIAENSPVSYDVGKFGNNYFTYVAAFGAFTDVPYETSQDYKNIFGYAAYIMEGVKRLPSIKPIHLKAEFNDEIIEGDFVFGMISNSKYVAGMKYSADFDVSLTDGLFEILFIKNPSNPIEAQALMTDLLWQNVKSKHFVFIKSSTVRITADKEIPWTLDGEFGGNHSDILVENLQNELKFITEITEA
jgi:YegS/Rv2252/BmrU family lipid kinase